MPHKTFEEKISDNLHQYLRSLGEIDQVPQASPDIEDRWQPIASAYIPDGAREFRNYPVASLGWMMYIGMAVAQLWDDEWTIYSQIDDLYLYLRNKRGYDALDEYIREDLLMLRPGTADYDDLESLVSECAARVHQALVREQFEPATKEAFDAYVACLHQLYRYGAALQLHRLGYHMHKLR